MTRTWPLPSSTISPSPSDRSVGDPTVNPWTRTRALDGFVERTRRHHRGGRQRGAPDRGDIRDRHPERPLGEPVVERADDRDERAGRQPAGDGDIEVQRDTARRVLDERLATGLEGAELRREHAVIHAVDPSGWLRAAAIVTIGTGVAVGAAVGTGVSVGAGVGVAVGSAVGSGVGASVGTGVGTGVGASVGVGSMVGVGDGSSVGAAVGSAVGAVVGEGVSVGTGAVADGVALGATVGNGVSVAAGESVGVAAGVVVGVAPGAGTGGAAIDCGFGDAWVNQSTAFEFVSVVLPLRPPGLRSMLEPAAGAGAGEPSTKVLVASPQPTASTGAPPMTRSTIAPPVAANPPLYVASARPA